MSGRPGRNTPIGALLYVTLIDSLLDLNSFVAALGYANIPSGVRTFNSFVNTGLGNHVFLARLQASRFALTPEVLLDALIHTDLQLFSESRLGKAVCPSKHTPDSSPSIHPVFYTARPLKKSAPSGSSKAARRDHRLPIERKAEA